MRGVTLPLQERGNVGEISTRTPHAGSDPKFIARKGKDAISTRTPHAGSDYR